MKLRSGEFIFTSILFVEVVYQQKKSSESLLSIYYFVNDSSFIISLLWKYFQTFGCSFYNYKWLEAIEILLILMLSHKFIQITQELGDLSLPPAIASLIVGYEIIVS